MGVDEREHYYRGKTWGVNGGIESVREIEKSSGERKKGFLCWIKGGERMRRVNKGPKRQFPRHAAGVLPSKPTERGGGNLK